MARVVTFGRQPTSPPPGNFREVHFPQLAQLDVGTNEGFISRILNSDGADTRELPRTISFQEMDTFGHDMAAAAGSIWEVTVDGETGIMSGKGWFADDEWGRKAAFAVMSKKLFHNSIDLAEVEDVKITEHGDFWDDDFKVDLEFMKWKFGKTTLVAVPAFANAHGVDMGADELKAALDEFDGPLVVDCPSHFSAHSSTEIVASMDVRPSWDYFNRAEADIPHPIIVDEPDENGWIPIYGHLAQWRKQTRDAGGRLRHPPRARDNYANYTKPGVLTDKGMVNTGPITLFGGHVTWKEALENVENCWADVSITDGKHGPWVCGVVRPHIAVDLAKTYTARASQISGLWPDGQTLRLISSVTAAGYPITASEDLDAIAASFAVDPPSGLLSFTTLSDEEQQTAREWVMSVLGDSIINPIKPGFEQQESGEPQPTVVIDSQIPELVDTAGLALEVALALEEDLG